MRIRFSRTSKVRSDAFRTPFLALNNLSCDCDEISKILSRLWMEYVWICKLPAAMKNIEMNWESLLRQAFLFE